MEAKDVLYAAVGAPVVVGRKMGERVADWRERMSQENNSYGKSAEKAIEGWAAEGRKVIDQIGSGNVAEEISSKVDLDQAKEQVGKLRDQLEDMLDTWRASFRPERIETSPAKQPAKATAKKPSANRPSANKPEAKSTDAKAAKPAAKAAKPTTAKAAKPAAKTAKPATAKKPAAKPTSKTDTTKSD